MNSSNKRQKQIIAHVLPKPITHGMLDTSEIAVPESESRGISPERQQKLRDSFGEQGTNLVPLIVRPTKAYGESVAYEVIYGADWCLVAKELEIEKLWVWGFEMTEQQAATAKEEMEQLVGSRGETPPLSKTEQTTSLLQQLENSFQSKIETITNKIDQSVKKNEEFLTEQVKALRERPDSDESKQVKSLLQEFENSFQSKLKSLTDKVEQVVESVKSLEEIVSQQIKTPSQVEVIPEKVEQVVETVKSLEEIVFEPTPTPSEVKCVPAKMEPIEDKKLNLLTADRRKLIDAIKNQKQAPAAWNAIQHLKAPGRELTWKNLEKLAKAKSGQDKIKGFGDGIYKKLQQIGYIPD